jgi:pimeloyl-ACP methyl ester carboxylesterase
MVNESSNHTPQIRLQNIADAELSYLLYEGEGPPLLFLHATGFPPWLWHPLARELADRYRILAPASTGQPSQRIPSASVKRWAWRDLSW